MEDDVNDKAVDEYVELCKDRLVTVMAELAKDSTKYIYSEEFFDVLNRMKDMANPKPGTVPFPKSDDVYHIWKQIISRIDKSVWMFKFKRLYANFNAEQLRKRKEQIDAEKREANAPKPTLRYEDCPPGEYVSYDKEKRPSATFVNAQLVIRDLGVTASFNEFTEKKIFQYNDKDITVGELRNLMWDRVFVDFAEKTVISAMDAHCRRFTFHPIKDYFESIRHLKNEKILDTWLTKVVGAEDNELNRSIGRKMFVAIVARIYEPGRKFDQMIVFESDQGAGKSTMLEIIAGTEYFNSGKILTMTSKEQMEAIKGRIIYESADLVGHGKADVDSVKAFLSQNADRGRWAYATEVRDHPRTNIFVGTTNKNVYLLDETGNRRIWPILCNCVPTATTYEGRPCPREIDLPWLRENRDQLFSEALALYEDGYSLILPRDLWGTVTILQNQRMIEIPMTDEAWEVFGLSTQEGLLITDNSTIKQMDLRIFSRDIIKNLFPPSIVSNSMLGRNVKTAMNNIKIIDDLRWEYKPTLRIDEAVNSGYVLTVTKPEHYDFVKATMAAWKRRREAKSIANATM